MKKLQFLLQSFLLLLAYTKRILGWMEQRPCCYDLMKGEARGEERLPLLSDHGIKVCFLISRSIITVSIIHNPNFSLFPIAKKKRLKEEMLSDIGNDISSLTRRKTWTPTHTCR